MGTPRIVITAPLTEIIDHAGYFIQMSMASLPIWLEGIIDRKYPTWLNLEWNDDGTAARRSPGRSRADTGDIPADWTEADEDVA